MSPKDIGITFESQDDEDAFYDSLCSKWEAEQYGRSIMDCDYLDRIEWATFGR